MNALKKRQAEAEVVNCIGDVMLERVRKLKSGNVSLLGGRGW